MAFIFSGCEPNLYWAKDYHYVTSTVNKKINITIYMNGNSYNKDSLISYVNNPCNDSLTHIYILNSHSSTDTEIVLYDKCIIYNLNDTTSISDNYIYASTKLSKYIINKKGEKLIDSSNHRIYDISNFYLTINEELLNLMTKDYSMLNKFKEYYNK